MTYSDFYWICSSLRNAGCLRFVWFGIPDFDICNVFNLAIVYLPELMQLHVQW